MSNKANQASDVTTALTLVIPEVYYDQINVIREPHDKAYGRWMPHINFMFPFVPEDKFDSVVAKLEPVLQTIDPFTVKLDQIGYFVHNPKDNATFHVKPSDPSGLIQLFEAIRTALPDIKIKHEGFAPHLTIGQFRQSDIGPKKAELEDWLEDGFEFTVNHINIIKRDGGDKPFTIRKEIKLKS